MLYKNLLMSIAILIPGISYNSFENSLDYFSYLDDAYALVLSTLTLKQITLLALHNGLISLFQPKTAFYALGLAGCLTGSKLLYSAIADELKKPSIEKIDIEEDIKSQKQSDADSKPEFPFFDHYYHSN